MKNKLKSIAQKITIVISILLTFTFVVPTHMVQAEVNASILLSPFISLLAGIGDGVMYLLQGTMIGEWHDVYQEKDDLDELLANDEDKDGDGNGDLKEKLNYQEKDTSKATELNKDAFNGDYNIPIFKYSPEEIFNNKIAALDVNFIQNSNAKGDMVGKEKSSVYALRPVISKWYVAIRNLALVGLLSVLVYVGIRMLISSASSDKAKYKQMLFDWIIAMCLLLVFHFIMSFVMIVVEGVTDMLGSSSTSIRVRIGPSGEGTAFNTNLIGLARLGVESTDVSEKIAFTVVYLVLVIYTGIFTFVYLKRLLYMAFLTLMAPLVTLTYPIDKISDGKAQAFDTWIKEYVFNALLQPFHLLIYTILVSSAISLAANNMLYAIAAIGFMLPAEKLLRKMFGFEKAGTASAMGAFAGGALASQAISKIGSAIAGKGKTGGKSGSDSGGSSGSVGSESIRTTDKPGLTEGMDRNAEIDSQSLRENQREQATTNTSNTASYNQTGGNRESTSANTRINETSAGESGQTNTNEQFRSRIPQAPQGFRNKAKAIANVAGNKTLKGVKKTAKRAFKAAPGAIAKAAGAATFGLMGLAAGVATGDISKVAQFAATGAAAGGAIGGALENQLEDAGRGMKKIYNEGLYGEEGARLLEAKRDYAQDDGHKGNMKQLLGSDSKETMDKASDFAISGIEGDKNIANAIKYQQKLKDIGLSEEQAFTQAAQAANIVQEYGEESFRDSKKRESAEQDMKEKIMVEHLERTGNEMAEKDATRRAKAVMSAGDQYLGRKKVSDINKKPQKAKAHKVN